MNYANDGDLTKHCPNLVTALNVDNEGILEEIPFCLKNFDIISSNFCTTKLQKHFLYIRSLDCIHCTWIFWS